MTEKISRREALKLGTTAAVSAAITPHIPVAANFSSDETELRPGHALEDSSMSPSGESDICFIQARQMPI
jgi:hypothetical protein